MMRPINRAALTATAFTLATALLLVPRVALAATAGASTPLAEGKLAGFFAAAILAALICYSVWLLAQSLIRERDRDLKRVLVLLTILLVVKTFATLLFTGFSVDVGTVEAWALKIASVGPAHTYQQGYFLDYPPAYLYALWAAGALAHAFGVSGGAALKVLVEFPPLIGDFGLSLAVYLCVRRLMGARPAWIALAMVALNPALLFDSVVWGQADSPLAFALFLSVAMMLEGEFEVGWSLAALSVLIKPQALSLLPVLGLWTLMRLEPRKWWRAALAFVAVIVIGAAPFQIGHPWDWLPNLYINGAAYYHETSVNAFNLMALIGGLRASDGQTVFGISYFALGMSALVPLYGFIAWMLTRAPTGRNLLFASFLTVFGMFMLAPRMHERYFYAAVAFALPLALSEPAMLAVFVVLTLTCLFNLAYVLHTLQTTVFLDTRDPLAMITSVINLVVLAAVAGYGWARVNLNAEEEMAGGEAGKAPVKKSAKGAAKGKARGRQAAPAGRWFALKPPPPTTFEAIPWLRSDTVVLILVLAAAAALRFWNLGHPHELVFDEVHFVGQARHYLHGETFLDPHPPLAKLMIALGIKLFGDVSWAWRLGVATTGTVLAGVTYLLGRRMFRSRVAGALAASFIVTDGLFLVDSRVAVIDIVYLTFAAISYLFMFRFIQSPDWRDRRRTLVWLGIALGLCLGSKLYVPACTFLLVAGFVVFTLARPDPPSARQLSPTMRDRRLAGAVLLMGGIATIFYLVCFLPHYYLGWWGGIEDLFHYYSRVIWYEKSVSTATHPYASPWWSWPLMLRPVAYWQNFPDKGDVASIWGAGNPILWWGVIPAMTITAVRAIERPDLTRAFLVIGYLANFVIWIPIGRILFLYHYMPSVYIGYLALGVVLSDFWKGECEFWETFAVLLTLIPALAVGLGHMAVAYKVGFIPENLRPAAGMPILLLLTFVWIPLRRNPKLSGRFVCIAYLGCALGIFLYFLPLWLGLPVSRAGYYARMWFEGPGLRNWI
jgi:dolichyl-phosphate-mannose--protein O-mannosyl transferase/Gpi18-like mannosyltransferase